MEELSDEELRAKTDEFRSRIKDKQEDLDGALLEEAFAVRGGYGCRMGGGRRREGAVCVWVERSPNACFVCVCALWLGRWCVRRPSGCWSCGTTTSSSWVRGTGLSPHLCAVVIDGKAILPLLHKTGWGFSVRRRWLGYRRVWEG